MVHQCNDTIRRLVQKHGGAVIKTIGDGTMASFPEPKSSVEAAIEIQKAFTDLAATRPEPERIALRIGMHYGSGIVRTHDIFGDVVNMASRVESVAAPGQIVLSEEIYEQVRECGFTIRELGRFTLKGKAGERTLFRVLWNEAQSVATDCGVGSLDPCLPASSGFKLQLIHKDGTAGTEYPVSSELAIGLSKEHTLVVSGDFQSPSVCARVFVQDEALFVEERGSQAEGVFLRLASAYVLEHQDIFLAGQQMFRYAEMPGPSSSSTAISTDPSANADAADTAELLRTDARGNLTGRYPLKGPEVRVGRAQGTYVFPDDNLMSRAHIRILRRGEDYVLDDLGSRNGTFVKVRGKVPFPLGSALLIAGQILKAIQ